MFQTSLDGTRYRVFYKHVNFVQPNKLAPISNKQGEKNALIQDALLLKQVEQFRSPKRSREDVMIGEGIYGATHVTICFIETEKKVEIARGYSFCSASDMFEKRIGRRIAFARAMKYAKILQFDLTGLRP